MSVWTTGCSSDRGALEAPSEPPAPTQMQPRLMRSIISCRFVRVACGGGHAAALTHDGRLFTWGWNGFGQCGLGDAAGPQVPLPRAIGRLTGRTVVEVACGAAHTVALVNAADVDATRLSVYAWGAHQAGQLGHTQKALGKIETFAAPSEVTCLRGVAGRLEREGADLVVVDDDGAPIAQPLSCGLAHTALVSRDGRLFTWGSNQHGQCGREQLARAAPDASPAALATSHVRSLEAQHVRALGVACGAAHTLVLAGGEKAAASVYAFGLNSAGQLGVGTHSSAPASAPTPVRGLPHQQHAAVVSVACGEETSAAVTRNGELYMWGHGGCGQLGLGSTGSMRMPRQVALPGVAQVAIGMGHALARTTDGALYSWGYPGTWQHAQDAAVAAAEAEAEAAEVATGSVDGQEQQATAAAAAAAIAAPKAATAAARAAPILTPLKIDLGGSARDGPVVSAGGAAPYAASFVAAGRFFGCLLGEPVDPMPEGEAALRIQSTFRRDRAERSVRRRRREHAAAEVIGHRANAFLARRALSQAAEKRERAERDAAAARVQAHQRRRLQAKRAAADEEEMARDVCGDG